MDRLAATLALPLVLALACSAGCAMRGTRIRTDDPEALIWLDGQFVGRGAGEVRQLGPSHTGHILVTAPDGRRARAIVARQVTQGTVDSAVRTLGLCLVLCWEYPREIEVPLPPARPKSGWAIEPEADRWLLAPGAGPTDWDAPPRWLAPPPRLESVPAP
jgi:hypothetical protein